MAGSSVLFVKQHRKMTADESTTAFLSLRMRLRNLASGMLRSETEADDAL